jgi:hypothetical protein
MVGLGVVEIREFAATGWRGRCWWCFWWCGRGGVFDAAPDVAGARAEAALEVASRAAIVGDAAAEAGGLFAGYLYAALWVVAMLA